MTVFEIGKLLETLGAVGIAYVGLRAAVLEIRVGRHLHHDGRDSASGSIEDLRQRLDEARRFRQSQFGFKEALIVGAGTALIAVGCGLYLYGLLSRPH